MSKLEDALTKMAELETVAESAAIMIDSIQDELKALKPNQASIDALVAKLGGTKDRLVEAMKENTVAEEEEVPGAEEAEEEETP